MGQLNPILANKNFGALASSSVMTKYSQAHYPDPLSQYRKTLPAAYHPAAHLLAEVTGTASCKGQRADIGMAGVERRSQQYFTPLIHTLYGAEAGAGLGGQHSSLIHHPTGNPK